MTRQQAWHCYRHETLESTSDEARRVVAAETFPDRFVVWTDRQTKGRGRGSNTWWSDSGSLTVTLGIDPRRELNSPRQETKVALATAMACASVIESALGRQVSIRWPNDVEIDGKKLAGCLVERIETADGPRLLIGVGINVSTRFDEAPADVQRLATSIRDLTGRTAPRTPLRWSYAILLRLLHAIDAQFSFLNTQEAEFDQDVNDRDALNGYYVRIRQGVAIVEGYGRGISADGSLRLETADGLIPIYGGQVLRD